MYTRHVEKKGLPLSDHLKHHPIDEKKLDSLPAPNTTSTMYRSMKKQATQRWRSSSRTTRRRWIFFAVAFVVALLYYGFGYHPIAKIKTFAGAEPDTDMPPTWEKLWQWEKDLPQHNPDLPFPEGKTGRYLHFANQIQQLGWNNQLNEVLMNSLLAYKSKRAYVFQPYVWKGDYYPWPRSKAYQWPPRTPANALMSGPAVGGPWDPDDDAPRSVSEDYYHKVCPQHERRIINTNDIKPPIMWDDGMTIFKTWEKLLRDAPERCIEIWPASRDIDGFPQTFDLFLWGSDRILNLWEMFSTSPISRLFDTSPVVRSAVDRNEYLFLPRGPKPSVAASRDPYDRMLAIHLRRGDYKEACLGLAQWNSTFYSWNLTPQLPDKFINPEGYTYGKNTPENVQFYLKHCYPTDEFIMNKIQTARSEYIREAKPGEVRHLDVLFLLTNDKTGWVDGLKEKFKNDGWNTIVSTWDLQLDQEQKDVGMAVDMDIARKAAVFIGNGWSSFTSNIVHRRLMDKKPYISTRFY